MGAVMAKREKNDRRLFWPTFGLIVFLLLWLGLCTAGFWYLYQRVAAGSADPQISLSALQWMTWPYAVLVISGPLLVILSIGGLGVVKDLLAVQKLIIGLPDQLQSMQTVLDEFRALRAQMITDVSRANDANSTPPDDTDGGLEPPPTAAHVQEFMDLYEEAKGYFYKALEDYNTRGEEPLIVQRGGTNFVDIASTLRDKREFDKSADKSIRIAEFVIKAFELERASRRYRSYLTANDVKELRSLKAKLRT